MNRVILEITSFCNRECEFCWFARNGEPKHKPKEEIIAILKDWSQFADVSVIGGGEISMHPDVMEIIAESKKLYKKTIIFTAGTVKYNEKEDRYFPLLFADADETIVNVVDSTSLMYAKLLPSAIEKSICVSLSCKLDLIRDALRLSVYNKIPFKLLDLHSIGISKEKFESKKMISIVDADFFEGTQNIVVTGSGKIIDLKDSIEESKSRRSLAEKESEKGVEIGDKRIDEGIGEAPVVCEKSESSFYD